MRMAYYDRISVLLVDPDSLWRAIESVALSV